MAESFFERRKRELGLAGSISTDKKGSSSDGLSFFEKRKMALGLIPDTREKFGPPKPAELQPAPFEPNPFKRTQSLTKPFNAKPLPGMIDVSKVDVSPNQMSPDQWVAERDKQRANVPSVIATPAHYADEFFANTGLGQLLNRFSHSADKVAGVDPSKIGGIPLYSSGNRVLDKTADIAGTLAGYTVNPAQLEQSLVQGGYNAADNLLNTRLGQTAVNAARKGLSRTANVVNPFLNRAGINVGSNITDNMAQRGLQGAIAGAYQNVGIEGAKGNTNAKDIGRAALEGAAFGGAGDAALGALSSALRPRSSAAIEPTLERGTSASAPDISTPAPTPTIATESPKAPSTRTRKPGERAFINTLEQSGKLNDEVQQGLQASPERKYQRITNLSTVEAANRNIAQGIDKAEANLLGKTKPYNAEDVATGMRLIDELQKNGNVERAVTMAEQVAKKLTEAGQTVQAASIYNRLTPEGALVAAQRKVKAINDNLLRGQEPVKISTQQAQQITDAAAAIQASGASAERAGNVMQIMDDIRAGKTISAEDKQTISDFVADAKRFLKPADTRIPPVAKPPKEMSDKRVADRVLSYLEAQEQAAKERLRSKGVNISSNPLDVWADYATIGALKLAKGAVKFADWSGQMVQELGEDIRPHLRQIYEKSKEALGKSAKQIEEETISVAEKVANKYIKSNGNLSAKDIDNIRNLAKQVSDLSGKDKMQADMALQKVMNSFERASNWDRIQTLRYIAMLFNTGTQAVNALSGPMMATQGYVADVFGTMVDIAMSKVLKQPRTTTLYGSNPLKFIARWFKGAGVGGKAGAIGVNPSGITSQHDIRGLTFKSLYNPLGLAERGLGAVSKGADYATYSAVYQSELQKQAYLDAINSGIKGRDNIKRHMETYLSNPPESALVQADRIGRNTTFQRSDTLGGTLANWAANPPGKAKIVKPLTGAVFPFVRTPVNMASTAVTLTPGGIIKGLYQLTSHSDASRREAIRTLSLGLTGTAGLSSLGYYLSQLGIITGANDSGDKEVDALREQVGQGKYRFNTSALMRYLSAMFNGEGSEAAEKAAKYREGDKQFDYNKLQPIAFPLAIGAGLESNKEKGAAGALMGAASDAYGSLFGMSTLKSAQDVFQPSYGGTLGEKALGPVARIAESFLKSFSPSLMAQEARRQDPIQRKTGNNNGIIPDVLDYYKSRTPGLSQSLPPSKTTLGQNKLNSPGVAGQYLNPYKSDVAPYNKAAEIVAKVMDSTGDTSLAPKAPDKSLEGKDRTGTKVKVTIPPDRYAKYQEDIGNEVIKRILAIPANLTDKQKADIISGIYDTVYKIERNKLKREFGIRVTS